MPLDSGAVTELAAHARPGRSLTVSAKQEDESAAVVAVRPTATSPSSASANTRHADLFVRRVNDAEHDAGLGFDEADVSRDNALVVAPNGSGWDPDSAEAQPGRELTVSAAQENKSAVVVVMRPTGGAANLASANTRHAEMASDLVRRVFNDAEHEVRLGTTSARTLMRHADLASDLVRRAVADAERELLGFGSNEPDITHGNAPVVALSDPGQAAVGCSGRDPDSVEANNDAVGGQHQSAVKLDDGRAIFRQGTRELIDAAAAADQATAEGWAPPQAASQNGRPITILFDAGAMAAADQEDNIHGGSTTADRRSASRDGASRGNAGMEPALLFSRTPPAKPSPRMHNSQLSSSQSRSRNGPLSPSRPHNRGLGGKRAPPPRQARTAELKGNFVLFY